LRGKTKKILFLYTELAAYFLACIDHLESNYDVEVHIVRWKVNEEAPFNFNFSNRVSIYNREDYSLSQLKKLVNEIDPGIIYCSGWMDKDYVRICRKYKSSIPVIVGIDNKWRGDLKQKIAKFLSPLTVGRAFNHAWVAGDSQKKFALNLGFKETTILTGFYSADTSRFYDFFDDTFDVKRKKIPHRFIYVGRYYDFKGVEELWQAFEEVNKDEEDKWELWCFGVGDIKPVTSESIKHFGFVQPEDLKPYILETSVFVLPSRTEPWGVVVHEFAASGYSMILSDEVGSASQFLKEGKNGYTFRAGNKEELKKRMKTIMSHTDKELISMGELSYELSKQNSPEIWSSKLMKL